MDFFNKIKKMLTDGDIKKTISNFIAIIIVCIILLISWSVFFPEKKEAETAVENENIKNVSMEKSENSINYNESLDRRLEEILGHISGVGEVEVMITYETSEEVVPALNVTKSQQTTQESDKQGGTRTIKQENISENVVTINSENYKNSPIVIKEIKPVVRGVIVVAEGAGNPEVKNQLIEAVTTIFQIKSHKVKVYDRN
ncbi:MAG: stage sporulation protein [Candidatus Petromonas sp.]|nr:stage sporulation protein [Candidatus Petromonas sp.]